LTGPWFHRKLDPSDLVQESLLKAIRSIHEFQGQSDAEFLAWLRKILARKILNTKRDSKTLATGSLDWTANLWDVTSTSNRPKAKLTFKGHMNAVVSLAFSPDGKILASGSDDHRIKFWDLITGKERGTLRWHKGDVEGIAFSQDSNMMITVVGTIGGRGEMRIWRGPPIETSKIR
jgi:WD40 repeat protein